MGGTVSDGRHCTGHWRESRGFKGVRDAGELVNDVSRVQIYNGLVPSGFAQIGTRVALGAPDDDLAAANREWQRRRDETLRQLDGLPVVRPGTDQ